MARIRTIKPDFYLDDELAELSIYARFIFPGLWCLSDKAGRLEDKPKRLKLELLGYDDLSIDDLLNELSAGGFITRYSADSKNYIQINNFEKHQKTHNTERGSLIPPPNGSITVKQPLEPEKIMQEGKGRERKGKEGNTRKMRFSEFWNCYPKKKNKGYAEKAFRKLKLVNGDFERLIKGLEAAKQSDEWQKESGQFIPYPQKWLNGRGWEDEQYAPHDYLEGCLNA